MNLILLLLLCLPLQSGAQVAAMSRQQAEKPRYQIELDSIPDSYQPTGWNVIGRNKPLPVTIDALRKAVIQQQISLDKLRVRLDSLEVKLGRAHVDSVEVGGWHFDFTPEGTKSKYIVSHWKHIISFEKEKGK